MQIRPLTAWTSALLLACCLPPFSAPLAAANLAASADTATETAERVVITRADDLPRVAFPFSGKLLELIDDRERLNEFFARAEAELRAQLDRFDIRDTGTVRDYLSRLRNFDLLAGRESEALDKIHQVRALEEKPADRLLHGILSEVLILARRAVAAGAADSLPAAFGAILREQLQAMPWAVIEDEIKSLNGVYQYYSETLLLGGIETVLQNSVDQSSELGLAQVSSLAGVRLTLDHLLPLRDVIVEVTGALIAASRSDKPDIWAERDVDISDRSNLTPVIIAINDSGVDSAIFAPRGQMWSNPNEVADGTDTDGNGFVDDLHGIAFDLFAHRTTGDLYPLSPEQAALYPEMISLSKGLSDLQNAIDSEEAALTRQRMANLPREEFQPFIELLNLFGNFTHGTHVAGIAAAGNPAARLLSVRITFGHELIPPKPTIEEAVRGAQATRDTIAYLRANGVRVVNMSWGGNQAGYEYALQANGIGDSPEQRAEIARILFGIGYDALYSAMRDAPEILFIPAAGNSADDVDFHRDIPSSIDLPNVLVVGAVNQAGDETSFTSYGRNVRAHANGFNVESYIPGGRRLPFSGTSMSAPNVANLAGKLLAIDPSLSPTDVIELIRAGIEVTEDGRRFLIHPRRSIELLDQRLAQAGQ